MQRQVARYFNVVLTFRDWASQCFRTHENYLRVTRDFEYIFVHRTLYLAAVFVVHLVGHGERVSRHEHQE